MIQRVNGLASGASALLVAGAGSGIAPSRLLLAAGSGPEQVQPSPSPSPLDYGGITNVPDGPAVRFIVDTLLHPDVFLGRMKTAILGWMHSAIPVVIAAVILAASLWLAVKIYARLRDRQLTRGGRRIRVLPPPEVELKGGERLWMGLHGLIPPWWKRVLVGQPPLVWEVVALFDDVQISLWVPDSVPVALVEHAIDSAWPGASLVEAEEAIPFPEGVAAGAQLRLARPEWLPIGSGPDSDPLRLCLAAMTNVSEGEVSALQIVARPVPPWRGRKLIRNFSAARSGRRPGPFGWFQKRTPTEPGRIVRDPTSDAELRAVHVKAGAPLWECSVRLAVVAPSRGQAKARAHSLASAFAMFDGLNSFRRRKLFRVGHTIRRRILVRSFLLSVPELALLGTLPATPIPGLDSAGARILSPSRALPTDGRVLGISNSGVAGRSVALSVEDARHHVHVLGETGTGKSTLMANLVLQDAAAARSAVVIDPKGDLVEAILERLPEGVKERVCLIDPTDPSISVGLNVLEGQDPELVVDQIAALFKRIYEHHWGPRSDDILRAACLTLTKIPGATLAEVPLLLTNLEWRRAIRAGLDDPVLRHFWEQFDHRPEAQRAQDIAPLMNKLRAFLMREAIRTILGQAKPKRDIGELLDGEGLILVRIPKGLLGEDTSRLLGGLVIGRVWQACMERSAYRESQRPDVTLYVDEMHNYLTLPRSFEDLLAEARGYRLSLVLAHQHLGQLNRDVREALDANARTKVVFACSPGDALALEKHFRPLLSDYDLSRLPAFTAACRPCLIGGMGNPFTFRTVPLEIGSEERALDIRITSGEAFGISRWKVEREIRNRHMKPEITLLPRKKGGGRSTGWSTGFSSGRSGGASSPPDPDDPESPGEAA